MANVATRESNYKQLVKCVLNGSQQQEVDLFGLRLAQLARLDAILDKFGVTLCRSAARSADSWHYNRQDGLSSESRFAFTLGELYILLETALEIHIACRSSPLWRKLAQLVPKKPIVFLGGTCSATTWRQDVVVPFCRANDFDYFDPQVPARSWTPALIHVEERAKLESSAFIFYVSSAARSLTSMIEVAYLVARRKNLIAIVSRTPVRIGDPSTDTPATDSSGARVSVPLESTIDDCVTAVEQNELARARDHLMRLAERNSYPVFETLQDALRSCTVFIKERAQVAELIGKHAVLPLELVATRYRDRLGLLHAAFWACAPIDSRIPFVQAYTLLQQACARENVACIRLPHCSRRSLLALLDSSRHASQFSSGSGCCVEEGRLDSSQTRNSSQPALVERERERGANVLDKLLAAVSPSPKAESSATTGDDAQAQRLVTFDELCFLFGCLLEFELARRSDQSAVLDSLDTLTEFLRCLMSFLADSVSKHTESKVQDPGPVPMPSTNGNGDRCQVHDAALALSRCAHDRRPPRDTVHLRGSTSDCALFGNLLIPLLARNALPFCLGDAQPTGLQDRCACDCGQSLPDLIRMTASSRSTHPDAYATDSTSYCDSRGLSYVTNHSSDKRNPAARAANADISLCARLRERFADRLRYRCPFTHARLLVYAFTRHSKSVVEMIQCAHCIGEDASVHRRVLLFVEMFEPGDAPDGELLNGAALKDYNRVRMYLLSMAKSHLGDTVRIAYSRDEFVKLIASELSLQDV